MLQDSSQLNPGDHVVQFYDAESKLIESVANYLAAGFRADEQAIVIATQAHLHALEDRMMLLGFNLQAARQRGDYLPFNAAEMLSRFMQGTSPNRDRFFKVIGTLAETAAASGRPLRAFGEMVAILWAEGNSTGAIELEALWNELIASKGFSLLCAYPMARFRRESEQHSFAQVCAHHTRFIPSLS